jgi:hypothetical protein
MTNIPDEIRDKIKAEFPDKTAGQTASPELYNKIQLGHRNCAELGYSLALPQIATLEKTIEDQDKLRIADGLEIERLKEEVQKLTNELDNIKHPF